MEQWLVEAIAAEEENAQSAAEEDGAGPSSLPGDVDMLNSGNDAVEGEGEPAVWRILAVACGCTPDRLRSFDSGLGGLSDLKQLSEEGSYEGLVDIQIVWNPTLASLRKTVSNFSPTLLYFVAPSAEDSGSLELGPLHVADDLGNACRGEEIVDTVCASGGTVQGVYLDAAVSIEVINALRERGILHVICWLGLDTGRKAENGDQVVMARVQSMAMTASSFSRTFFSALLSTAGVGLLEAYALAARTAEVYAPVEVTDRVGPSIVSNAAAGRLPDHTSMDPPPHCPQDLSAGVEAAMPDVRYVRLVSPRIELRLVLAGSPEGDELESDNLAMVVRMLRSLLVMDIRASTPIACRSAQTPRYISDQLVCRSCEVATGSGATFEVLLGGPTSVLEDEWAVQLALASTLATDAMHLQFRLPNSGSPLSGQLSLNHAPTTSAAEIPAAEVVLTTSVWVARTLHQYASSLTMPGRALLRLGIMQVGSQPVKAMSLMDLDHLKAVLSPLFHREYLAQPVSKPAEYGSGRPALLSCNRKEFMDDLVLFHERVLERRLDIGHLPILNGSPLDLYTLYVEVCKRGGFKRGTSINWKGQIFSKMSNFTEGHKQTGVGNALKKHYSTFLLAYEQYHPSDVASDMNGNGEGSRRI